MSSSGLSTPSAHFVAPSYLSPSDLHALLQSDESRSSTLIVDVRDEDFVDGHVPGALNVPSESFARSIQRVQEAARGKQRVVFHCALSQVRGPSCAMIMATTVAKQRQAQADAAAATAAADSSAAAATSASAASASASAAAGSPAAPSSFPPIFILETGFKGWVRFVARLPEDVRTKQRDTLLADYNKETHGYSC